MRKRYVVHFSCGAASAVAAKLMVSEWRASTQKRIGEFGIRTTEMTEEEWGPDIEIVNAFIQEEHADNRRFLEDVSVWLGVNGIPFPIRVLRDEKYDASTLQVFRKRRFMKNRFMAPCSHHLKREVLAKIAQSGDVACIGYTDDDRERERAERLEDLFPNEKFRFPLIEHGLKKADCLAIVERAGLVLPMMYRLGYNNANCIGCVKGGEGYWNKIRRDFPEQFVQISNIQESIGPGAYLFRDRSTGVRYGLKDLPPEKGYYPDEPEISCGFLCAMAEEDMAKSDGDIDG